MNKELSCYRTAQPVLNNMSLLLEFSEYGNPY